MHPSRRYFLQRAAAWSAGFAGLRSALADVPAGVSLLAGSGAGYGPLWPDQHGLVDLPAGFTATPCSAAGDTMSDGLLVPGKHDGMGAFPGRDGPTILIRNHEISPGHRTIGPFDAIDEHAAGSIDTGRIYDIGSTTGPYAGPSRGGCTSLIFDTRADGGRGALLQDALVLVGCEHNCAGGITPRQTWISCEESIVGPDDDLGRLKSHGWCFEVPATMEPTLVEPRPIEPMGRFNHEAVAVDPASGIIYMTEDRQDGAIWRFIPDDPDRLHEGGLLQALAIKDRPKSDLRNWDDGRSITPGTRLPTEWITLDEVHAPDDSLRYRAFERGAARFARGEGMWHGDGCVHFACTTGGRSHHGQLWRYTPASSDIEGQGPDRSGGGALELFIEPNDPSVIEHADNITVAPWGDLIVCEDGLEAQFLLGVTPQGKIYKLAHNRLNHSEFAGATFSPDGRTLFVNIQNPGVTLAITGPWRQRQA